jgi:TolB-like protein
VLPFTILSGDPEQDYFADGMVEEVITGLSRIKWLRVISRNSSFIYKNKPIAVTEVADKLDVRYVIEGSVRKSQNRVRISAQLIDAENSTHLWADQYDRLLEDVFALQEDITRCVVGAIEPSLRKAEGRSHQAPTAEYLDAYDLVLRSLQFVFTNMPKEAEKAIPLLEKALKLEPIYAAAHAFLSWCLHARFSRGGCKRKIASPQFTMLMPRSGMVATTRQRSPLRLLSSRWKSMTPPLPSNSSTRRSGSATRISLH